MFRPVLIANWRTVKSSNISGRWRTASVLLGVVQYSSNSLNFGWLRIWTAKHQYSLAGWMCSDRGSPLHSNRISLGRLNSLITLWSCALNMSTFPLTCLLTTESRPQAELHSVPAIDRLSLSSISRAMTCKTARPHKVHLLGGGGGAGGGQPGRPPSWRVYRSERRERGKNNGVGGRGQRTMVEREL